MVIDLVRNFKNRMLEELIIKPRTSRFTERTINDKSTILLVCHPRGGSNWLGEIMKQIPGSVLIDEPLWRGYYQSMDYFPNKHEGKLKEISDLGFYFDQYIPVNYEWPEAQLTIQQILQGVNPDFQLWDKNELWQLKNPEVFITKFNYGHLLLPWIHQQFNIKSVVLHRHPCAVVASQLMFEAFNKIPQNPQASHPKFQGDAIYQKFVHIWNKIATKEEYLAAIWAIKTRYILDHKNADSLHLYYENLLTDFGNSLKEIKDHLDIDFELNDKDISNPSSSTPKKNHLLKSNEQLKKWNVTLDKNQIYRILKITELFRIEIYDENPLPIK